MLLFIPAVFAGSAYAQQEAMTEEERQARSLFVRGMTQAYIGNHDKAVGYFQAGLKLDPGSPDVFVQLSKSLEQLEEIESSLFYARAAIDAEASEYNLAHLGGVLDRNGRTDEALPVMERLVRLSPGNIDYSFGLARVYVERGMAAEAAEVVERFYRSSGESASLSRLLVKLYEAANDRQGIERTLAHMAETQGDDPDVLMALGVLKQDNDEIEAAVELFSRVLAIDSTRSDARARIAVLSDQPSESADGLPVETDRVSTDNLVERARILASSGDAAALREAHDIMQPVVDSNNSSETQILWAGILYQLGEYDRSLDVYEAMLSTDVRQIEVWQRASAAALRAGEAGKSLRLAEDGLLFFPDDPGLLEVLAFASMNADDADRAREIFQRVLDRLDEPWPPTAATYLLALAHLSQSEGDLETARTYLLQAQHTDPTNAIVRARLAVILASGGDIDTALSEVETAHRQNPNDAIVSEAYAHVLHLAGRNDDAAIHLDVLTEVRRTAANLELAGDILWALDRRKDAVNTWREALQIDPGRETVARKLEQEAQ